MSDQHGQIDATLQRTLGSATLTPEQRRRHLDRIAERGNNRRFPLARLLRDGTVAAVLIALLIGAWTMIPVGDSTEMDPMTALAAMKEEISAPESGATRYIEIEGAGMMPGSPGGLEEFTVRAWERWTDEGSAERAIHNYSSDGELVGRVVELTDRTIFETPGNWNEATSGMEMHPPQLFQPLAAVQASEPSELIEQLEQILEEEDVTTEDEGDGKIRVWMLSPEQPADDMLTMYEDQLGVQITGWGVEHLIDTEAGQRLEWRVYIEDDEGERHTIQRYRFDGWHEIDEQEIPDDAFAEYTELSEQALIVPLPDRIELSIGLLEVRDIDTASADRASVTYAGPAPLLIEIRTYPLIAPDHREFDGNTIELDAVDGHWVGDLQVNEWPRLAVWEDESHRYWLNARNLPEGGWTEDDLYEVIEAISLDSNTR